MGWIRTKTLSDLVNLDASFVLCEVHEQRNTGKVYILTKGDNSPSDDRANYAQGHLWLQRHHVIARVVGVLPYCGWIAIIVNEKPIYKYILIVAMGLRAMIDD